MAKYLIALIFVGLFLTPCNVPAAGTEKAPEVAGLVNTFIPKAGAWSEYALFDKKTGKRTVMRMAIVGVEKDAFWYEVTINAGEERAIVKMMITGDPNVPENIKRIIVKSGSRPAQELDKDSVQKVRRLAGQLVMQQSGGIQPNPDVVVKDIETGQGEITVPAGTFAVSLHKIIDTTGKIYAEYRFSEKVHPFGIVTLEADQTAMILAEYGDGAQSLITEEPEVMSQSPVISEQMFRDMMNPPPASEPKTENNIRQIPGMGTGYEPKQ
jgi:hypothetical protein